MDRKRAATASFVKCAAAKAWAFSPMRCRSGSSSRSFTTAARKSSGARSATSMPCASLMK